MNLTNELRQIIDELDGGSASDHVMVLVARANDILDLLDENMVDLEDRLYFAEEEITSFRDENLYLRGQLEEDHY